MRRGLILVLLTLVVTLPSFAETRTWTGVRSANWSDPANWSPAGIPQPQDSLSFPGNAANLNMNNDLPPYTSVGPMSFFADAVLNGNPLTLTGDLSFVSSPSAVFVTFNVDLRLGASIKIYQAIGKVFNGAFDVNGKTLTFSPSYATSIRGPIRGDGAIIAEGVGLNIVGSGSFSGTISGRANVVGSYPGASFRSARFSGDGTVGPVHAGLLYPGDAPPSPSVSETVIGTLQTGSLAIDPAGATEFGGAHNSNPKGRLLVDVVAGGAADLLKVKGTVTLDATLDIALRGTPAAGETFLLIDNDGSDAISGRFTGLSEGAMITVGSSNFWITYRGGDGNDVVLNAGTPPATAKTWTGATSTNWSDPNNWSPVGVPVSGDALHFPPGARLTTNNDLAGFAAGPMLFDDDYVLSGNAITLTGDLLFGSSAVDFICSAPLIVAGTLKFHAAGSTRFDGPINVGSNMLTIETKHTSIHGPLSGTSELVIEGEGLSVIGDGPFAGRFRGRMNVVGSYPNAVADGWTGSGITGDGEVQAIAAMLLSPGSTDPGAVDPHQIGTLRTQFLSINENYRVDVASNGDADQIVALGPISLYGKLTVTISGALAANQSFTIIDNTGTTAVYEHFQGLPEGSVFYVGESKFRVTYKGGDGNDVVLTHLGAPKTSTTTTLTQNRATSEVHQPVTFSATVTSETGMPTGTVTFSDGSSVIGSVALMNGSAQLTTKDLPQGTHTIVATYSGNESYDASASAPLTHTVVKGNPNVSVTAIGTALVHGDAASFRVAVSAVAGDTRVPAGDVTLRADGIVAGSGTLASGSVTIAVSSLRAGSHTITATYAGNDEFNAAHAEITQSVAKARTNMLLESATNPAKAGANVTLTVSVTAADRPALAVDGPVTLRSNGQIVSEVLLAGNRATVQVGPLVAGDYEITASYAGSDGFDPSSAALTQHVVNDTTGKKTTATTLTQNRVTSEVHQPVTFTARVTSLDATPIGSVTFIADATELGAVPLENGTAELRVKTLSQGTHAVTARYMGNESFESSLSSPLVHSVVKGNPHINIAATTTLVYGEPASFRVVVSPPAADERIATGRVTLSVDELTAGSGLLDNGVVTISVPTLAAGTHKIRASYEGNDEFASATATITVNVAKANVVVALDAGGTPAFAGVPVDVAIHVDAVHRGIAVDGDVLIEVGGVRVAQIPLIANVAVAHIGPFEAGQYDITARFLGNDSFDRDSGVLRLTVTEPLLSVVSQKFDEGNGVHEVEVQVQLTGASTKPIVLDYRTLDGTATAANDYAGAHGTIVFAPGETTARVPIRILGDTIPEPDETFDIELTNAVGASVTSSAPLVIQNDEPLHAPPVTYTYATENGVALQAELYAPLQGEGPRPLILWIPGDAAYDAKSADIAALRFTANGYAVASIGYRPAGTAPFPAQVEDLANAVRWLRANAAQLNIDPNRFTAWGIGAGGHLAALLGTGMQDSAADTRVQSVVVWNGISDPATLQDDALACSTTDWNAATSATSVLLGCPPQLCSASADAAAVAGYAGAGDARTLLIHAAANCTVGSRQSQRLYDALRHAGVDATLRVIDQDADWTSDAFAAVNTFLETKPNTPRRRAVGR